MSGQQEGQQAWKDAADRLVALIGSFGPEQIDRLTRDELLEFVQYSEYATALEWIVSLRPVPLTPRQAKEVERIARGMNLDLDRMRRQRPPA
jgi:hypothetical protein